MPWSSSPRGASDDRIPMLDESIARQDTHVKHLGEQPHSCSMTFGMQYGRSGARRAQPVYSFSVLVLEWGRMLRSTPSWTGCWFDIRRASTVPGLSSHTAAHRPWRVEFDEKNRRSRSSDT